MLFAPQAAPCNGISVTSVNFNSASQSVYSGTDKTVGVVYKYANAGTAPDGTMVDAHVKVISYSNNQDTDQNTFRDADLIGDETTTNGFDRNLQPNINQESGVFASSTPWNGSITYQISFYVAGTLTPKKLTVAATSIDNDGATICGGLKETVSYDAGLNQILINTPANTTQIVSGQSVTPNSTAVQNGIGIGNNYANSALFVNVSQFNWTYSFSTSGNCTANQSSASRLGSLNLTCQITFDQNFASTSLSGTVYNDVNGLTDSIVNGTGTNAGGLFANLIDSNGYVYASASVAANGAYNFPAVVSGTYNIQISTNQGIESSLAPVKALPTGWVNTGENLGADAGNDGAVNGLLPVTVASSAISNANFGIEQRPIANNNTAASQTNPGGTNNATVAASTFSATDTAPGTVSNIRITGFPTNATSITINGTKYTAASFPGGGVTVPANTSGNPTQTILVDPIDGAVTVGIPYVAIDNAGIESSSSASASVPFTTVSISGNVFDDTNGLTDSTVNGTGTNAGNQMFVNLLNNSNNVVQTLTVPANGVYSFTNVDAGTYTIQLTVFQGTVGNPATTTRLPGGWAYTGENIGAGAGSDGTPNGELAVVISTAGVANANFGIEQRPVATSKTAASQPNLGGTNNGTVPASTFSATDTAPGTVSNIRITGFPTNATSITINGTKYTAASFPGGGVTVPANTSGNPTQTILVDPIDGAVTVEIIYIAIDNANVASEKPATAYVPFTNAPTAAGGSISGTFYTGNTPLRNALVVLIDAGTTAKQVTRTDFAGKYLFRGNATGKTYVVQPLSGKYSFSPANAVINLTDDIVDLNFNSTNKNYHPKDDFDGDGKSDIAVYRPSEGTWYVLSSSDGQMRAFRFGSSMDMPVSADFDGDGKADYAVFRPENGFWYIWQSQTQQMRAEQFGAAADKLMPADYDGDGKADITVYRNGIWYTRRSSDDAFEVRSYGAEIDTPLTGDYDGDGKADLAVYRPVEGIWYSQRSKDNKFAAYRFGLESDVPAAADFDGDGFTDIAQYRDGHWFILGTTGGFESGLFGSKGDRAVVGDYDGDGRADAAVYRDGLWLIRNSADGIVRHVYFGLPDDVLIK